MDALRTICSPELGDWAHLSTIGQFLLVLVSIYFIWHQLHQAVELQRAANSQALSEQAGAFNAMLIADKEVAKIWHSYGTGLDGPEFEGLVANERYEELLVQWLILHENIFYQNSKRLLEIDLYQAWDRDLRRTVMKHELGVFSVPVEDLFAGRFGEYLAALCEEKVALSARTEESERTQGLAPEI